MRSGGLTGTVLLVVAVTIVVLPWVSRLKLDTYAIASVILAISIGVGISLGGLGALKEIWKLSIIGGFVCLGATVFYRVFIRYLGAWRGVDIWLIMGGTLMLLDRFIDRTVVLELLKPSKLWMGIRMSKKKKKSREPSEEYIDRLRSIDDELNEIWEKPEEAKQLEAKLSEVKQIRRQLIKMAESKPDLMTRLRSETYRAEPVQALLNVFLKLGESGLKPAIEGGGIIYNQAEESLGKNPRYVTDYLEYLAETDIVRRRFEDKVLACPKCDYFSETIVHYKCQKCASRDIEMIKLLEHLACGTVHEKSRYLKGERSVCPKCGVDVDLNALKIVGLTFKCNSCDDTFGEPLEFIYCKNCGGEFSMREAEFSNAYGYAYNPKLKDEIITAIYTSMLASTLREEKFELAETSVLEGKAKQPLNFTIVAKRGNLNLAIDLIHSEKGVRLNETLPSIAKFDDVKYARAVIVAIPSISDEAKGYLSSRGVSCISGPELEELKMHFGALLKSLEAG